MNRLNRKYLLVGFLALLLLGVQTVQTSSLHDHAQHQADCVLCHFDSHDQLSLAQTELKVSTQQGVVLSKLIQLDTYSFYYTPYQGRSPPLSYS